MVDASQSQRPHSGAYWLFIGPTSKARSGCGVTGVTGYGRVTGTPYQIPDWSSPSFGRRLRASPWPGGPGDAIALRCAISDRPIMQLISRPRNAPCDYRVITVTRPPLHFSQRGLRQPREQRVTLGDFGHFRRRRKAFERGREDGVGVGGAAGRLVEFRERERRAQFEAARALLLRDSDRGLERFLCGRGVGGIAFQQNFAANAMQFGVECAMSGPFRCRQRFVEDREGAVESPARASASARAILTSPSKSRTFCSRRSSTPLRILSSPSVGVPASAVAQPSREDAACPEHRQIVLARRCERVRSMFVWARGSSPLIKAKSAACVAANASVLECVEPPSALSCAQRGRSRRAISPRGQEQAPE